MRLVLSHITAYEFWLSSLSTGKPEFGAGFLPNEAAGGSRPNSWRRLFDHAGGSKEDMHILVGSPGSRTDSPCLSAHVASADLPAGAILQVGRELGVVAPELCFMQLAQTLSGVELIRAGNELCSMYFGSLEGYAELPEREPICTRDSILEFLEHAGGLRGACKARKTARWITDRSRSPRESTLAALLAAPSRLGGQQLPAFEANWAIPLDSDSALLTQRSYLEADICWPEKGLAIEYNSLLHEGEAPSQRDLEKITALQAMGMTVVPLSSWQFGSFERFSAVIRMVRNLLGLRNRPRPSVVLERELAHRRLLDVESRWRAHPKLDDCAWWKIIRPQVGRV